MRHNPKRQRSRGFTLIELMVVIVILGILGGAAVFVFTGATDDAKYGRAESEMQGLIKALDMYALEKGYPSSLADLASMGKSTGVPDADPWGTPYDYRPDDAGFVLICFGMNKQDGGDDDLYFESGNGEGQGKIINEYKEKRNLNQ